MSLLKIAQEVDRNEVIKKGLIGTAVGSIAGIKPSKNLKKVKYNPLMGGFGAGVGASSMIIGNEINKAKMNRRAQGENNYQTEEEL